MAGTGGLFQESGYRKVSAEKAGKPEKPEVYKMEDSKKLPVKTLTINSTVHAAQGFYCNYYKGQFFVIHSIKQP